MDDSTFVGAQKSSRKVSVGAKRPRIDTLKNVKRIVLIYSCHVAQLSTKRDLLNSRFLLRGEVRVG